MRSNRVTTLSLAGIVGVLLAGCAATSDDNSLPEDVGMDALPCTATVLDIDHYVDKKDSILYDLRYVVSVEGRAPYEDTQRTELTVIQVAQIVAVTKTYPCRASQKDSRWVKVDWNKPIKSPSPKASTRPPKTKAKPALPSN